MAARMGGADTQVEVEVGMVAAAATNVMVEGGISSKK